MSLFDLTTKNNGRVQLDQIPVLRQAFVVAGTLVILGMVLAYIVHPYFLGLPILVGGGLLFSGLVGICPMVAFLNMLPWNKPDSSTQQTDL